MNTFAENNSVTLPQELAGEYSVVSCLKVSEQGMTCILRAKEHQQLFLLKTASDPVGAQLLKNENDILEKIQQANDPWVRAAFPRPVCLLTVSDTVWYIRTYISGRTLEDLCEESYRRPGLEPTRALDYIIALTEQLRFLHTLTPPLIHRDIKPQNVVIDTQGGCHFIDFGISRSYQPDKKSDTFIMGTQLTAPPEQFGFRQTDRRSDLYSMGILLFYSLTGGYEVSDAELAPLPDALQKIIRKATMFDPNRRYQTEDELLSDLLAARYPATSRERRTRLAGRVFALLFVCMLCVNLALTAVLIRDRIADSDTAGRPDAAYTFQEPLIEEAVRRTLNLPEHRTVTLEDLSQITELYIYGLQVYGGDDEVLLRCGSSWFFDPEVREAGLFEHRGTIRSLEDLTHMPNLTILNLYQQQISDISALKDTGIHELGLGLNPLTDLSPLEGNTSIEKLYIMDLAVSDVSVISTLPNLTELSIRDTDITSLEGMEQQDIRVLDIYNTPLKDPAQLQMFRNLEQLDINLLTDDIVEALEGLPIRDLFNGYTNIESLQTLSALPQLQVLRFCGKAITSLTFDSPELPELQDLSIEWINIRNFRGSGTLDRVTRLKIYSATCESYEGLDEFPNLYEIECTQEQKDAIQALYPDNHYIFSIYVM